jgi:hypothetical protein
MQVCLRRKYGALPKNNNIQDNIKGFDLTASVNILPRKKLSQVNQCFVLYVFWAAILGFLVSTSKILYHGLMVMHVDVQLNSLQRSYVHTKHTKVDNKNDPQ